MKNIYKVSYETPFVEVVNIEVEQGFSISGISSISNETVEGREADMEW